MFYASFQSRSEATAIGYASSEDGIRWEKYEQNPVFEADGQ